MLSFGCFKAQRILF